MFTALGKTLRATSVHHSNWLSATFQYGLGRVESRLQPHVTLRAGGMWQVN